MTKEPWYLTVSMPVLLRYARRTYASVMRAGLIREGYDDIPANGLFVIGSLALDRVGVPISQIVKELGITKQGAGQLVDTLVTRGYLQRTPDENDRRQLIVTLTERGRGAAATQAAARLGIDTALVASIGEAELKNLRRALAALIELGRPSAEGRPSADEQAMTGNARFEHKSVDGAVFRNCSMRRALFEDIALSDARYANVDLRRARFQDVNMSGVSIDDANIDGMTIFGHDVQALIRSHETGSAAAARGGCDATGSANITIPIGTESARAFLPSKDFAVSKAFYEALGFPKLLDGDVAIFGIGTGAFILQRRYQKDWAENCMMQLMVDDLDGWWRHIEALDLPNSFGVPPPTAPAVQPWGLRIAYLVDPSGVLWHIAQRRDGSRSDQTAL